MAKSITAHLLLLFSLFFSGSNSGVVSKGSRMYPFACSNNPIKSCRSYLYHISRGLSIVDVAKFYNVQTSEIKPIKRHGVEDYLIQVPCSCGVANGTTGYFYSTLYDVKSGDTLFGITNEIYSGQVLTEGRTGLLAGETLPIHLLCGCLNVNAEMVVTYTIQDNDTASGIADLLSSSLGGIKRLNTELEDLTFIDVGWVLFVPTIDPNAVVPDSNEKKKRTVPIVLGIVIPAAIMATAAILVYLYRRRKLQKSEINIEDPKAKTTAKIPTSKSIASLKIQSLRRESLENSLAAFETERPVIFGLDEIEQATANFEESRKIGEGGYGSVYFGVLGEQEAAIKKMKSSKSKEFFAELKVLGKVHHINVVELIGYSTGDDHLYLVYEYVRNGSLSDHLHDPLLKGHQALSWNARAQIALDAARGIEYIHDHTKARYVHRDIKTSNILLDEGLRAKVADFGLAKLVERSNEEDCIATRLVGTPGYLPPESVLELQMTSKTDVFAFGVVLAELITGLRALIRDNREANKMKSLISVISSVFQAEETESALEAIIDGNLKGSYPIDEVNKMAELAFWCLSDEAVDRPEMHEIVVKLSHILMSSIEWEASLGGSSQVFTGVFNGR
ncbi:lysM domain receptor-like kinase 3 [Aristolochia californica]|uniref:lysM domain receptor-like kinase 3 n=1 Tax=Aristolochia californica TaxID=171875 RepID=UPI0035E10077